MSIWVVGFPWLLFMGVDGEEMLLLELPPVVEPLPLLLNTLTDEILSDGISVHILLLRW